MHDDKRDDDTPDTHTPAPGATPAPQPPVMARETPATPSTTPDASHRLWWVAALLLTLPFVASLVTVLLHTDATALRTGDEAPFEARLLTLFDAPPLVGPYSRHQWNHPGPLIFWLFGLPYRLLGRSPVVLQLVALALNLVSLGAIVRALGTLVRHPLARAVALGCVAVLVAKASATLDPSGLAVSWSPSCTLLPFAALVLLAAELGVGRWERLPFVVLAHAFVTQTHVVYVVPATLAVALGVGLGLRVARPEHRGLVRSGATLAALWSPVVLDQLFGTGNLGRVIAFFVGPRVGTPPDLSTALSLFAWRASEPYREVIGLGPPFAGRDPIAEVGAGSLLVAGLAALAVVALLVRGVIARRDARDDGALPLAAIALTLIVAAVPALLRIDKPEWPYLTWWVGAIAVIGALGAGATQFTQALDARRERIARLAAVVVVTLVGVSASVSIVKQSNYGAQRTLDEAEGIAELFPVLERAYACRAETQLTVASEPLWGVLSAGLVHLGRAGVQGHVDRGWEFMFGPGYAGGSTDAQLVIMGADTHGCRALDRGRWLRVADCRGETSAPAERGPARALVPTPWLARGTRGELRAAFDAERPADGAPWDAPGTIVFDDAESDLMFGLPVARVTRISVTSDDNDVYLVQQSRDGARWEPLTEIRPTSQWGLRTHTVELRGGPTPFALRIVPVAGDGSYSVGDVRVEGEVEALRVRGDVGVVGNLALVTDGALPAHDAPLEDPSAVTLEGAGAALTVELPAVPVDALALTATAHRPFLVEGSVDGEQFRELGRIPVVPGDGLVTRRFYLDRDVLASHVRIRPLDGEGPARVAELAPVRAPGAVVDAGRQDAKTAMRSGFSEHAGDDGWAWIVGRRAELAVPWAEPAAAGVDVLVSLVPFVGLPAPGTLTVRVGTWSVALPMTTGPQTVRARVPAEALAGLRDGALWFSLEPSDAVSPQSLGHSDDARELSVAVHRIEVRPALSWCAP
jgi:hypothetical protein